MDNAVDSTVGKQRDGMSSEPIYALAERLIVGWNLPQEALVLDAGGGAGEFSKRLKSRFRVHLLDDEPKSIDGITCSSGDLNGQWPYPDESFDAVILLEVIEHLENPRHTFREIWRLLKPGGYCVISTPNQLSLASLMCLVLRGQFQHFQNSCYPAHVTALLPIDFERITRESGLKWYGVEYTDSGRIPGTAVKWQMIPGLRGRLFSDNMAVWAQKP